MTGEREKLRELLRSQKLMCVDHLVREPSVPWENCSPCQKMVRAYAAGLERAATLEPDPLLLPDDSDEAHTYKVGFFDALRAIQAEAKK